MIGAAAWQVMRRGAAAGWDLDARAQYPWSALPGVRVIERTRA